MPTINRISTGNELLDKLSDTLFAPLSDALSVAALTRGAMLVESHKVVESVYFPVEGMISIVRRLEDGSSVEVAIVGRDGMTSVCVLLGDDREPTDAMVQIAGAALCLRTEVLRVAMAANPALRLALMPFVQLLLAQMAQSAACNARHTIDQRLARWLLTASDRVASPTLRLSHGSIAIMLGIRRPGVTLALAILKDAGLVSNGRNQVTIKDKLGLEAIACECYRAAEADRARIFPPRP